MAVMFLIIVVFTKPLYNYLHQGAVKNSDTDLGVSQGFTSKALFVLRHLVGAFLLPSM